MKNNADKNIDSSDCVIKPISKSELKNFLDTKSQNVIKYFITKSLFSQPENKPGQNKLAIQIPKEHVEQWFTQSLDVESVGAGSSPIDIYDINNKWGADIKMLNMRVDDYGTPTNGHSGEASLGQKFAGPGVDLDSLFKNLEFEKIKDFWMNLFLEKYNKLKDTYPIEKIYYLFILRPNSQTRSADFYFMGAVLDLKNIYNVKLDAGRSTEKSAFLHNLINSNFGNAKIYKSKKRLELRLKPSTWIGQDKFIKIETSYSVDSINLREVPNLNVYLENEVEKIKNVVVKFID